MMYSFSDKILFIFDLMKYFETFFLIYLHFPGKTPTFATAK